MLVMRLVFVVFAVSARQRFRKDVSKNGMQSQELSVDAASLPA
jgi:hypothetical protein